MAVFQALPLHNSVKHRGIWTCSFWEMLKVAAALVCVCAAAWCSPALAAAAAAGGRPDSGNFLDDKQWLTTISQYDKEVGQWNKFRDDDYFRTWSPGKPFDQEIPWRNSGEFSCNGKNMK
uniref:SPARC (osteonectin), cwcv and kazal like domains proteoglycan 3 n=1 Tax=Cairina moschata TaxID=8855 RepID=A0A8C3CCS4_CAIMO